MAAHAHVYLFDLVIHVNFTHHVNITCNTICVKKWDRRLPLDDKRLPFFSSFQDDVLYEVHANSDHWMIAGRKRGHVLLSTKQGFFKLFLLLLEFQFVLQMLLCTYVCSAGTHAVLYSDRIENNYFSIMLAPGCWICSSSSVGFTKR